MKKIVVAITGASGSLYAKRLFHYLGQIQDLEVGVVATQNAKDVWEFELGEKFNVPFKVYERNDFFAPFASGSAQYSDMVILPCSMGTLGRIASGLSDDLITRSADVMLKERRNLICVWRDTPINLIHMENMVKLSKAGALLMPACPSFYSRPQTFDQLADTVVHRILDQIGLTLPAYRWGDK
jgi:4-hydroxy-3-polyprenylbenzoate decarboxylase